LLDKEWIWLSIDSREALDALTFVLKNAIPYEHVDFWLSQMFIIKKQSAEEVLNKIHTHCNKNIRQFGISPHLNNSMYYVYI
jgi:hypothetical protein